VKRGGDRGAQVHDAPRPTEGGVGSRGQGG
jgi:hypothetical protein